VPKRTVLFDRHERLGGRIVDFHGWLLPVQYEGILAEHAHCRQSVVVFDTCHMGQIAIRGSDAAGELSRLLTQDAAALPVGRARYGLLLNERGGILDDTILLRLADDEFLLVVNAGPRDSDFDWLAWHMSRSVTLEDRSQSWGKLDVQGPGSFAALRPLVDAHLEKLAYFHVVRAQCCGRQAIVSRTGYTGELGYEIFLPMEDVPAVFDELLSREAVRPAGLGARDSLRLEMCYPLYGQDIDEETTPLEADLGRFVDLRREFMGAAALRAVAAVGVRRRLVAFRAETRRRAESGMEIAAPDGRIVGAVTSAAFAPSLGVSIAMGYVEAACAHSGAAMSIRHARGELPVVQADKPLYKQGACRTIVPGL